MTDQLDFWPATEKAPYAQKYWETLSLEDQAERITLLGRLIAKAVRPELYPSNEEQGHE